VARYRDYLRNDLLPAFGAVRLERLTHQHVDQFVRTQLAAGRGPITVRRSIATLSSALNDAIRQRRLIHNAARYTAIPAGLPRVRVHDLRHLAATIMIAAGVPLAMVSKTRRHSILSTTVDIYGHLTRQAAQDAVDATAAALDNAERKAKEASSGGCTHATTLRPLSA
jgi:integrase